MTEAGKPQRLAPIHTPTEGGKPPPLSKSPSKSPKNSSASIHDGEYHPDSQQHLVSSIERYNMNVAIESQSTESMRAELLGKGIEMLDDTQLTALSIKLNSWIEFYCYEKKLPHGSWFTLFNVVDKDHSGFVTFDELTFCIRSLLKKGKGELSSDDLKALWCTLDQDDSNSLHKDEMSGFLRLGEAKKKVVGGARAPSAKKLNGGTPASSPTKGAKPEKTSTGADVKHSSQNLIGSMDRVNMGGALATESTADMRRDLKAQGIPLPTDDELLQLSAKFNAWIESYRYDHQLPPTHSWFNLFSQVDLDGSGQISFDELITCVRRDLRKGPNVISHQQLKVLWCALDSSGDNLLDKDEAAGFFKLGATKPSKGVAPIGKKDKAAPAAKSKKDVKKGGEPTRTESPAKNSTIHDGEYHPDSQQHLVSSIERHNMNVALECTPTAEMKKDLEMSGDDLLDDAMLTAWAIKLTEWIEEYRFDQKLPPSHSWYQLFKEVDNDSSGWVTFDELTTCVRRELRKGPKAISHTVLKQLWCSLDVDSSNTVEKEEMASFFGRAEPTRKKTVSRLWAGKSLFTSMKKNPSGKKYEEKVAPSP